MTRINLIILFLFFMYGAMAQDQWLVTTKMDTIKGKITLIYGGPYQSDEARVKNGKTKSNHKAYQIKSVYLGENDEYETLKIDQRYQFAKADLKGKYFGQYLYIDPQTGNDRSYSLKLLVNWKGDQYPITNMVSKRRLASYFEECESLAEKIEAGTYKRKQLAEIFAEYDVCVDSISAVAASQPLVKKAPDDNMLSFIETLKTKGLYNEDLSSMLDDINLKLANNQNIPSYLKNAVLSQLGVDEALKSSFLELIE